jgi:hypothetical protein
MSVLKKQDIFKKCKYYASFCLHYKKSKENDRIKPSVIPLVNKIIYKLRFARSAMPGWHSFRPEI